MEQNTVEEVPLFIKTFFEFAKFTFVEQSNLQIILLFKALYKTPTYGITKQDNEYYLKNKNTKKLYQYNQNISLTDETDFEKYSKGGIDSFNNRSVYKLFLEQNPENGKENKELLTRLGKEINKMKREYQEKRDIVSSNGIINNDLRA